MGDSSTADGTRAVTGGVAAQLVEPFDEVTAPGVRTHRTQARGDLVRL